MSGLEDDIGECSKLVLCGADPVQLAGWLLTPVEFAAGKGNLRLFKKLIAAVVKGGVDLVGYRGKDGRTLFDAAARGGNAEIVSGLLRAGARPDLNIVSDSTVVITVKLVENS